MEKPRPSNTFSERIDRLKLCVLIPTYNNERTLGKVIDGVLKFTDSIIVVNDGSTDATPEILNNYPGLTRIDFDTNRGKGAALRAGFLKALNSGFEYALTIDSDGQHFPEDIPVFLDAIEAHPGSLLIGSRNMDQESVPKGSSFGNSFSNFWYWAETGIRLSDTQSGYRLYPLKRIAGLRFFTNRFEFEIEVIVKAAWKDVPVLNVPIRVKYDEQERVSHFRPYADFGRISLLNTWLVFQALAYYIPRNFIRKVRKKGIKRFFFEDLLQSEDPPAKKALSVALGTFIGIAPLWGFQSMLAIGGAAAFKLNKFITFAASNISIPPLIPFIVWWSLKLGHRILGSESKLTFKDLTTDFDVLASLKEYLVGSILLALISAVFFGTLTFVILKLNQRRG